MKKSAEQSWKEDWKDNGKSLRTKSKQFHPLLAETKVITFKTQLHAVNACVKRLSQHSFKEQSSLPIYKFAIIHGFFFIDKN